MISFPFDFLALIDSFSGWVGVFMSVIVSGIIVFIVLKNFIRFLNFIFLFICLSAFSVTETYSFNFTYPGQTIYMSKVKALPCTITYALPYAFVAGVQDCSRITWKAGSQDEIYVHQQTVSAGSTGFLNMPFYAQAPGYFATSARSVTITVQYVGEPPSGENPDTPPESGGDSSSTVIAQINNNTSNINNNISTMSSNVSNITSNVDSILSALETLNPNVWAIFQHLDDFAPIFSNINQNVSDSNTYLSNIDNSNTQISSNTQLAKNYLSHILGYIRDSVMPNLSTIKDDTSVIKNKTTAIASDVSSIDSNITTIKNDTSVIKANSTNISTGVSSLDAVLKVIRLYLKDNIIPDLREIKDDQKSIKQALTSSNNTPASPERLSTISPSSTPIQQIKSKLLPNFSFFNSNEQRKYEVTFTFDFPFCSAFGNHGIYFTLPFTGLTNENNGQQVLPSSLCTIFDTFTTLFRSLLLVLMAWGFLKVCLTVLRQW